MAESYRRVVYKRSFPFTFKCLGGKNHEQNVYTDGIYEFDPKTGTWSLLDNMMEPRAQHGISVISTEDVQDYC